MKTKTRLLRSFWGYPIGTPGTLRKLARPIGTVLAGVGRTVYTHSLTLGNESTAPLVRMEDRGDLFE
jgi:hypothetical protein